MPVLYYSQICQYTLYTENTVRKIVKVQNFEPSYYEYCLVKQEY